MSLLNTTVLPPQGGWGKQWSVHKDERSKNKLNLHRKQYNCTKKEKVTQIKNDQQIKLRKHRKVKQQLTLDWKVLINDELLEYIQPYCSNKISGSYTIPMLSYNINSMPLEAIKL